MFLITRPYLYQWIVAQADYSDPSVKLKTPSESIRLETESNKYPNEFHATLDDGSRLFYLINYEAHKITSGLLQSNFT